MSEIKRKFEIMICTHNWKIWTVSMKEAACKCQNCGVIRKAKLKWGNNFDPYKPLKF